LKNIDVSREEIGRLAGETNTTVVAIEESLSIISEEILKVEHHLRKLYETADDIEFLKNAATLGAVLKFINT
jgi:hypothetical protein